MRWRSASLRALALTLVVACSAAAAEFEVPPLRSAVTDLAGLLSPDTRQRLESALQELQRRGGTQLAVLTVPDLAGLTIEQASIRVADAWKLGSEEKDDGVLLMVARDERRVRIEVGQGLEGVLTDAWSKRIIDEAITPLFRQGDMDGGVMVGVFQIARRTNPDVDLTPWLEGRPRARAGGPHREPGLLHTLFVLALVALVLSMRMGFLPFLFLGGRGMRRGHFSGGFSGGGFSGGGFSGGGGGFSGGGASGSW